MSVLNVHPNFKVRFNNDFKKVNNSEFVEGTALIAYSGDNRNSSDITEPAFNDALPSLGLVPLVGHWLAEKQNFGGHDITIEFVGNQLVLKDNTVPYGVVKENNNAEWVEIEENGVKHNYLKADVVLWYGRYPEPVQKVIDDGINQSMEINVQSYSEKENGNFQIDKFEFSALCLLGKEVDEFGNKGTDNVEPCFESASVVVDKYIFNDQFKEQFNNLLFEFNNQSKGGENEQMSKIKEGENMDEKLELLKVHSLTSDSLNFNIEELSIEELETKIQEHFELLASQKEEEVANALRAEKYMDRWGDECSNYSYVDHNDSEVFAWDRQNGWCLCGFTYSMSGDSIVIDFESKKKKKFEIVDFIEGQAMDTFTLFPQEAIDYALADKDKEFASVNTEFEELKVKVSEYEIAITEHATKISEFELTIANHEISQTTLTEQFNIVTEENIKLLAYKNDNELGIKTSQIDDIISDFESVLGENEEFKVIKTNAMSYEIEALEEKLYALEGKVKHAFKVKTPKKPQTFSRVSVDPEGNTDGTTDSYYGDGIKFIPKN